MNPPWSAPDPEAAPGFTDFVVARTGPLTGLARGLVRSDADAQDLVQETLAKALLHWGRAVLVLRYYEQLPDDQIAEVLGVAQATVRSCAARGLASLRRAGVVAESLTTRS